MFGSLIGYDAGHEAATVQSADALVLVALASIPTAWVTYQLDWIRQRHEFVERYDCRHEFRNIMYGPGVQKPECPWYLRLLGETSRLALTVRKDRIPEAKRLFPEALVTEDRFPDAR